MLEQFYIKVCYSFPSRIKSILYTVQVFNKCEKQSLQASLQFYKQRYMEGKSQYFKQVSNIDFHTEDSKQCRFLVHDGLHSMLHASDHKLNTTKGKLLISNLNITKNTTLQDSSSHVSAQLLKTCGTLQGAKGGLFMLNHSGKSEW